MIHLCLLVSCTVIAAVSANTKSRFAFCRDFASYNVTFFNHLTHSKFPHILPSTGLVFSPMVAAAHSNRFSILTVRGYASKQVQAIAETGDNSQLIRVLRSTRREKNGVRSYASSATPTMPGNHTTVRLRVNCRHPLVTALAMISPSPDWFVQISNVNLYSRRARKFISGKSGNLIAYDAGTDDGQEFTPPSDTSLDIRAKPRKNIAPLIEDETDRFHGRVVGKFIIKRDDADVTECTKPNCDNR